MNTMNTTRDEKWHAAQRRRAERVERIKLEAEASFEKWLEEAQKSPVRARLEEKVAWGPGRRAYVWMEHPLFGGYVCTSGLPDDPRISIRGSLTPRAEGMASDWMRSLARELAVKLPKPTPVSLPMARDALFGEYPTGPEQVNGFGGWAEMEVV